jgi:hypothetical protein
MVLATARPGSAAQAGLAGIAELVELDRLEEAQAELLVAQLSRGRTGLDDQLIRQLVARSAGNPLFIEELTSAFLDRLARGDVDPEAVMKAIPASLLDLLEARIQEAAPTMEVAQIGAAIGREFPRALLERVAEVGEAVLQRSLAGLVEADLLRMHLVADAEHYSFKHALVQDAAYGTLPRAGRRRIHGRIAAALETRFPEIRDTQPERLAEHLEKAEGMEERAIHFWRLAGQIAGSRSAVVEAGRHLSRARELVGRLPSSPQRDRVELDVEIHLGSVLRASKGPAGPETGRAFLRARDICARADPDRVLHLQWLQSLAGLFGYYFVGAQNASAMQVAQELRRLGEHTGDRLHRMIGYRTLGLVMIHAGRIVEGQDSLRRSLELHDPQQDDTLARMFGTDPVQTILSFLALSNWLAGKPDTALEMETKAMTQGLRVNHLYSLAQTAMFRIIVRALARDWESATRSAQETLELASRHSFRLAINLTRFYLSAERGLRTGDAATLDAMASFADAWGPLNYRPLYLGMIAEAHARAGRWSSGRAVLMEARALSASTGEHWIEPELIRLQGELALVQDLDEQRGRHAESPPEEFEQAIALARQQGALSWELRAALSLARWLSSRGEDDRAAALLIPIRDRFEQGFSTPDLLDAEALIRRRIV